VGCPAQPQSLRPTIQSSPVVTTCPRTGTANQTEAPTYDPSPLTILRVAPTYDPIVPVVTSNPWIREVQHAAPTYDPFVPRRDIIQSCTYSPHTLLRPTIQFAPVVTAKIVRRWMERAQLRPTIHSSPVVTAVPRQDRGAPYAAPTYDPFAVPRDSRLMRDVYKYSVFAPTYDPIRPRRDLRRRATTRPVRSRSDLRSNSPPS